MRSVLTIVRGALLAVALCSVGEALAQKHMVADSSVVSVVDTMAMPVDEAPLPLMEETATKAKTTKGRDWNTWRPSAKRAFWLGLVIPGAGQIYNRKYWKLPLIYGGFVGCAYAMRWNNQMYHDYSQAYLDIMDNDPMTQSYNNFLHLGSKITSDNLSRWQDVFKKRKDRYHRWRDMSFFCMVGVYVLSVVDAYVDASLSEFDISPDLSMRVSPAVFQTRSAFGQSSSNALGLQCNINF